MPNYLETPGQVIELRASEQSTLTRGGSQMDRPWALERRGCCGSCAEAATSSPLISLWFSRSSCPPSCSFTRRPRRATSAWALSMTSFSCCRLVRLAATSSVPRDSCHVISNMPRVQSLALTMTPFSCRHAVSCAWLLRHLYHVCHL